VVGVGQEREREVVFFGEPGFAGLVEHADAKNSALLA
jgi:hypothetical protein